MKKFLLLLSVFLSTLSLAAQNTASFTIESKPIEAGKTVDLNVTITNSANTKTSAFQFDLTAPEGTEFVGNAVLKNYFTLNSTKYPLLAIYTATSSLLDNTKNLLRVVVYSGANVPFSFEDENDENMKLPDSFVIGSVKIKAADNFSGGGSVTMNGAIIAGSHSEGEDFTENNAFQVVDPNDPSKVIEPSQPAASAEVYIAATSISLSPETLAVKVGYTGTLTATTEPEGSSVTWTSSDEAVATVKDGVVTGVKAGSATITATTLGALGENGKPTEITATSTVTVTDIYANKVTITKPEDLTNISLKADESMTFVATATCVEDDHTYTPTDATVTWSIAWAEENITPNIADVATIKDGKVTIKTVTAYLVGKTITVTATANGSQSDGEAVTASATITLAATPISNITLAITPENGEIKDGETATITATIEPANATNPMVTFTIPEGATVTKQEAAEGETAAPNTLTVVAGATLGAAEISAAPATKVEGDCPAVTATVTVIATPVESVEITLPEGATTSLKGGASMTLTATVNPATATDQTVTWSVDNTELATITEGGVLTAKTGVTGDVTVTATAAGNVNATKTITITGVEVTNITLDKTEDTLAQGESVTLIPFLDGETDDEGNTLMPTDKTVLWTAAWAEDASFEGTAPDVADFVTVDNGTVTIVKVTLETAEKKVVVTATPKTPAAPDVKATCTITLEKTNVTSVAVAAPEGTAADPALKQGETIQLTATVEPANATVTTVIWEVTGDKIAEGDVTVVDGLVTINKVTAESANSTVTVTATSNDTDASDVKGTFTITLAATPVETVKTDLTSVTLLPGTKVTGNVTEVGPDNATIKTLTYTSGNEATATITENSAAEETPEAPETPETSGEDEGDNSGEATTEAEEGEEAAAAEPVATFTITGVATGTTTATIAAMNGTETASAKATIEVTVEDKLTITTDAHTNPETEDAQVAKTCQIKYTANTTLPLIWSIVNEDVKADEPSTDEPSAETTALLAEEGEGDTTTGEGDTTTGEGEGEGEGEGDTTATDNKVAYIAEQGNDPETGLAYCLVEGIAPGTATVTATVATDNLADGTTEAPKAEDKIEVINVIADKLTLSASKLSMTKGDTKELTATLEAKEGVNEAVSIQEVEWTVSNDKVLEVIEEGDLTISFKAIANGTCTITATTVDSSDLTASCDITVAKTVTGIEAVGIDETEGADIRVYDLSGKCVATSAEQYARLGEGLYIIKTAKRTVKVLKADL